MLKYFNDILFIISFENFKTRNFILTIRYFSEHYDVKLIIELRIYKDINN